MQEKNGGLCNYIGKLQCYGGLSSSDSAELLS